jgi:hypothetical protein
MNLRQQQQQAFDRSGQPLTVGDVNHTLSHPQASAKSSYRRALFQAERRRVHGGYLGRRAGDRYAFQTLAFRYRRPTPQVSSMNTPPLSLKKRHPQASAKSSYRRALFQAERRRVHGGYLGRRAAVAKPPPYAPGILHEHAAAQPEKAPGGRMILLTLAGEIVSKIILPPGAFSG